MAWVRIDDHFDEHPKLANVSCAGWGLWMAGLAYCNRNLTDGFIPWSKAKGLVSNEVVDDDGSVWTLARTSGMGGEDLETDWLIDLLVREGLWITVYDGGRITGYRIHDYDDYQPSKEEVLAERKKNAKRQAEFRKRHKRRNGESNAVTNGGSNGPVTDAPYPTPKEEPPNVGSSTTAPLRAAEFDQFWSQYPRRAGSNPKLNAIKAWNASIRRGVSPADVLNGLHRYVAFLAATDKVGTETVLQASTFVGPSERWKESWDPPRRSTRKDRRPIDDYHYTPTEEVPQWPK